MPLVTRPDHDHVQRRALLVLGMHRSGTSALANLLIHLGAQAPRNLMAPNEHNPMGFGESRVLCDFHDRLLHALGSSWEGWVQLDAAGVERAVTSRLMDEFRLLIEREFGTAPLFVIKDPRICRLVPLWLARLTAQDICPAPILIIRNPLEVARSLELASGLTRQHALWMWLRHVLDAEIETRHLRRSMVRYSDLVTDPGGVANRVGSDLAIEWPGRTGDSDPASVVRPELRHHEMGTQALASIGPLGDWLTRTYQACEVLMCGDGSPAAAYATLDEVRTEFNRATSLWGPLLEAETAKSRAVLESERDEAKKSHEQLTLERAQLLKAVSSLKAAEEQLRRQAFRLKAEQSEVNQRVVRLEHEKEQLEQHLKRANQYIGEILGSASWRATGPLRVLAGFLGITPAAMMVAKTAVLGDEFYGALESPLHGASVSGSLDISGWTLSRHSRVDLVEALLGETSLGPLAYGLPRADVARAFPTRDAEQCGFEGTVVVDRAFSGAQTLTVRVTDGAGHVQVYRRPIVIHTTAAPTQAAEPELPPHRASPSWNLEHARPAAAEPHFLVVADAVPTPDMDSGSFRLMQILKALTELGYFVTLVSHSEACDPQHKDAVEQLGLDLHLGRESALAHLMIAGHQYHYVLLSRPEIASRYLFPVRAWAINATVVYDMVDLHWLRWERAAAVLADERLAQQAAESKRVERFNALGSDLVIAITETEKRTVLENDPSLHVEIIPNIHPLPSLTLPEWRARRDVMFIGGFQHQPNEDAVCYFVREIWPLIIRELPEVLFNIVGSNPTEQVRELESSSVRVVGYVPDPSPYFEQSRVFVSPLRYGAGMKGKIGQSMSFGLPVVTTSIGAEGMLLVDGQNALIADDPDDFARAVVRLYRHEAVWRHIAANSVTHIQQHFSPAEARRRISAIFPISASINHRQTVVAK